MMTSGSSPDDAKLVVGGPADYQVTAVGADGGTVSTPPAPKPKLNVSAAEFRPSAAAVPFTPAAAAGGSIAAPVVTVHGAAPSATAPPASVVPFFSVQVGQPIPVALPRHPRHPLSGHSGAAVQGGAPGMWTPPGPAGPPIVVGAAPASRGAPTAVAGGVASPPGPPVLSVTVGPKSSIGAALSLAPPTALPDTTAAGGFHKSSTLPFSAAPPRSSLGVALASPAAVALPAAGAAQGHHHHHPQKGAAPSVAVGVVPNHHPHATRGGDSHAPATSSAAAGATAVSMQQSFDSLLGYLRPQPLQPIRDTASFIGDAVAHDALRFPGVVTKWQAAQDEFLLHGSSATVGLAPSPVATASSGATPAVHEWEERLLAGFTALVDHNCLSMSSTTVLHPSHWPHAEGGGMHQDHRHHHHSHESGGYVIATQFWNAYSLQTVQAAAAAISEAQRAPTQQQLDVTEILLDVCVRDAAEVMPANNGTASGRTSKQSCTHIHKIAEMSSALSVQPTQATMLKLAQHLLHHPDSVLRRRADGTSTDPIRLRENLVTACGQSSSMATTTHELRDAVQYATMLLYYFGRLLLFGGSSGPIHDAEEPPGSNQKEETDGEEKDRSASESAFVADTISDVDRFASLREFIYGCYESRAFLKCVLPMILLSYAHLPVLQATLDQVRTRMEETWATPGISARQARRAAGLYQCVRAKYTMCAQFPRLIVAFITFPPRVDLRSASRTARRLMLPDPPVDGERTSPSLQSGTMTTDASSQGPWVVLLDGQPAALPGSLGHSKAAAIVTSWSLFTLEVVESVRHLSIKGYFSDNNFPGRLGGGGRTSHSVLQLLLSRSLGAHQSGNATSPVLQQRGSTHTAVAGSDDPQPPDLADGAVASSAPDPITDAPVSANFAPVTSLKSVSQPELKAATKKQPPPSPPATTLPAPTHTAPSTADTTITPAAGAGYGGALGRGEAVLAAALSRELPIVGGAALARFPTAVRVAVPPPPSNRFTAGAVTRRPSAASLSARLQHALAKLEEADVDIDLFKDHEGATPSPILTNGQDRHQEAPHQRPPTASDGDDDAEVATVDAAVAVKVSVRPAPPSGGVEVVPRTAATAAADILDLAVAAIITLTETTAISAASPPPQDMRLLWETTRRYLLRQLMVHTPTVSNRGGRGEAGDPATAPHDALMMDEGAEIIQAATRAAGIAMLGKVHLPPNAVYGARATVVTLSEALLQYLRIAAHCLSTRAAKLVCSTPPAPPVGPPSPLSVTFPLAPPPTTAAAMSAAVAANGAATVSMGSLANALLCRSQEG